MVQSSLELHVAKSLLLGKGLSPVHVHERFFRNAKDCTGEQCSKYWGGVKGVEPSQSQLITPPT